jgi:Helicase conserved C-terminal domain
MPPSTVVRMGSTTGGESSPRTLADVVRGWDDATLRRLLAQRPDLTAPTPADTTQLTSRACTRTSVTRVLDRVDRFTLTVLEALAVLREPVAPAPVAALTGAPRPEVDERLRHLRGLALLWGPEDDLRPVRVVHEVIGPHPAGLGPWLSQALSGLTPAQVARLAEDVGVDGSGDKLTVAGRVGTHLSEPSVLESLIAAAGPDAEAVLQRLAWGPPTGRLEGASRSVDLDTATSPVERLLARGLLVALDTRSVVLPREVGLYLRGHRLTREPVHTPPTLEGPVRDTGEVDTAAAGAAFELVRRVEVLLETWGTQPPVVLRGGGVSVRDLRAAATLLGVDSRAAALHIEVAREAGLLDEGEDDGERVWLPTNGFDVWLARSFAERWAVLARAWLDTQRTLGLVGRRDDRDRLVNALAPDLERPPAPETRRLALEALAAADPGQACATATVVARVAWLRPRRGTLRDDLVRWTLDEAALVGCVGLGALSTHGAALLAEDTEEAGGEGASPEAVLAPLLPGTVDHVLVQADLTAVAPGPLDTVLARDLAVCAEVESRGGATVYRFTEASVRHALDSGWTASDLHEFLAQRSRTPVPQPLTYLIDDVARRHGRLRVGVAESYLRCDDESLVREILADPGSATLRLRRVAPTVLVTDLPVDLVLARLREAGRAPAAESADGSVTTTGRVHRRTRAHRRPRVHDVPAPRGRDLDAAVAAIRGGDRTAAARPEGERARLGGSASGAALARLREAAEARSTVWLAYVDRDGGLTERLVDPLRIEGGWLTAYDHRADDARTFAVRRISAVSPASAPR